MSADTAARRAFVARAAAGGIVPLVHECVLDADQPVAVLRKVARPPFAFLLESAIGGERWARYTFLGTEPREAWRYRGGAVSRWTPESGWADAGETRDPMGHLAGRLRPLAVTSAKRADQVPDVPTMMESGVPDFEVTVWNGAAVPVATPGAIVNRLHDAMMKALSLPDLKLRFSENGVAASPTTREEFMAFIKSETAKWAKVVKEAGIHIE